jgi:hypothetical protein
VLAELIAHPAEQVILAEVLALRMLYLNTVQILGRGRELGTEDLKKLIEGAGPPFPAYFYDEVAPPSALFGGWVPAAHNGLPPQHNIFGQPSNQPHRWRLMIPFSTS